MTEINKAAAGGAASTFALAAAGFVEEGLRLLEFPDPFVSSAGYLVAALIGFLAVWAVPDSRSGQLKATRRALEEARGLK